MSISVLVRFGIYHRENPQVWRAFELKALSAVRMKQRFGAKAIFEILRWETAVSGTGEFKLCNDFTPYYARLFEEVYPAYRDFFRKKDILPEGVTIRGFLGI